MERIADLLQFSEEENAIWMRIVALLGDGAELQTYAGMPYRASVCGNELVIERRQKTVTRSDVVHAYRLAKNMLSEGKAIRSPKDLNAFGASYLFPIFKALGII